MRKNLSVVTVGDIEEGAPEPILSARGRQVLFSALSVKDEAAEAVAAGKRGVQVCEDSTKRV